MASPDLSGYVDLTIYDMSAADLVDRAASDVEAKMPDAQLPVGSLEMVLLEAIALLVSEVPYAINRLPGAVTESLLARVYGIERSQGLPPLATATFTFGSNGGNVPPGTSLLLSYQGEDVQFTTDIELSVAAPATTGTVAITGAENTEVANGTPSGTALQILSDTTGATGATLATAVAGGAMPEEAETYLDRASARLQRLTSVLVLPEHFAAAAAEDPAVYRVKVVDNYDGTQTAAGHVTVAVMGQGGAFLTSTQRTALEADLTAQALATLAVHVLDPTVTAVNVTATVKALPGHASATVQAAVVAALGDYLSTDTWDWDGTVRRNELIAVIDKATGVDYVESLTAPAADVVLTGVAPLASLGTTTVTVS